MPKGESKKAKRPAKAVAAKSPPAALLDLVDDFLADNSFVKAHAAFRKQRQQAGVAAKPRKPGPSLVAVYRAWEAAQGGAVAKTAKADASSGITSASSSSSASSDSDSDSDSSSSSESDSASSSSSDSDSSSSSDGDGEADVAKAPASLKRKAPASPSSSDSSSDSTSASESSSDSAGKPQSKKQKTAAATQSAAPKLNNKNGGVDPTRMDIDDSSSASGSDSSSSDSGSDSTSDSDSDSDDDSSSDDDDVAQLAAKLPLPESDGSSSSSSDSDSDDGQAKPRAKLAKAAKAAREPASDSSVTLGSNSPEPGASTMTNPPLPPNPVRTAPTNGRDKRPNEPFSRIPKNIKVDSKFASNDYVSMDYSRRAYEDLVVTKGKGFTKEKNKKKRGSFHGGMININEKKGIYFDD